MLGADVSARAVKLVDGVTRAVVAWRRWRLMPPARRRSRTPRARRRRIIQVIQSTRAASRAARYGDALVRIEVARGSRTAGIGCWRSRTPSGRFHALRMQAKHGKIAVARKERGRPCGTLARCAAQCEHRYFRNSQEISC